MRVLPSVALLATIACSADSTTAAGADEPGPPAQLQLAAGVDGQVAAVRTQLPTPITVTATDASARAVPNQIVNFVVAQGGGEVFAGTAMTNASGQATDYWTLGETAGVQELQVRAVDPVTLQPIVFETVTATAQPGPIDTVQLRRQWVFVLEGQTFPLRTLVSRAADAYGNEVTAFTPAVAAAAGWSSAGGVLQAPAGQSTAHLTLTVGSRSDTLRATSGPHLGNDIWHASWMCANAVGVDSLVFDLVSDSVTYDTDPDDPSVLDIGYGRFWFSGSLVRWMESGDIDSVAVVDYDRAFRQAPDSLVIGGSASFGTAALLVNASPITYVGGNWCTGHSSIHDRTVTVTAQ